MVTILQAMQGISDAAAVEQAIFDRRWQMVLDCLGEEKAPFSQGVLVEFRRRLLARGMHERLVAQSVRLAQQTGGFGFKKLRVALDSAPLWENVLRVAECVQRFRRIEPHEKLGGAAVACSR